MVKQFSMIEKQYRKRNQVENLLFERVGLGEDRVCMMFFPNKHWSEGWSLKLSSLGLDRSSLTYILACHDKSSTPTFC